MRRDPIAKFRRWYAAAGRARIPLPHAMALATVGARGAPSVRFVLLKGVDPRGFVFFTDARSRKGRELATRPRASLAFYWDATGKQVRVEGRIVPVAAAEADAYWATRPRGSRLAASVSIQSAPMPSHAWLLARWRRLRREIGRHAVPRPPRWGGFRLAPTSIEFWTRRAHRLHLRERYERTHRGWRRTLLQP
ncbi:MAG: pyridoxamine 5'-phosphate oxidase [Candidatus Binatia bacterium]